MYQPKTEKDIHCPLEYGLEIFGEKWKSRILCVLAEKEVLRYGELRGEGDGQHHRCGAGGGAEGTDSR